MSQNRLRWVVFFSQTGSEICNLINALDVIPDIIVTNNVFENINLKLLDTPLRERLVFLEKKPTIQDYRNVLKCNDLITLHGWLRIVPAEVCNDFNIYNLHPAPLSRYPHLKGKDPQKRTIESKLKYGGSTIHVCSPELDSGQIISEVSVFLDDAKNDHEKYDRIYNSSFSLWKTFLKKHLS
jgi:folate-dependent phosphoribosylglycinamide formyltransferase PurN